MFPITYNLFQDPGFVLQLDPTHWRIQSVQEVDVLSNALIHGGLCVTHTLINRHVSLEYAPKDPLQETKEWLREAGYDADQTVTLLTAASVEKAIVTEQTFFQGRLAAIVTAGVSNAARAGKPGPTYTECPNTTHSTPPGTINIALWIDAQVSYSAMVNTVITATEAKAAALAEMGVQDGDGDIATGTTTDAVIIAATQREQGGWEHHYAGLASPLGQAVGLAVHQAVREAVAEQRKARRWNPLSS